MMMPWETQKEDKIPRNQGVSDSWESSSSIFFSRQTSSQQNDSQTSQWESCITEMMFILSWEKRETTTKKSIPNLGIQSWREMLFPPSYTYEKTWNETCNSKWRRRFKNHRRRECIFNFLLKMIYDSTRDSWERREVMRFQAHILWKKIQDQQLSWHDVKNNRPKD